MHQPSTPPCLDDELDEFGNSGSIPREPRGIPVGGSGQHKNHNLAGGMMTQAEEGMKLFEAQQGAAAELDKARDRAQSWRKRAWQVGKPWENGDEIREK